MSLSVVLLFGVFLAAMGAALGIFLTRKQLAKQAGDRTALELATQQNARLEMEKAFREMATGVLSENTSAFVELAKAKLQEEQTSQLGKLELAKKEIEHLVKPLSEALDVYKRDLQTSEKQRAQEYGSLDRLMKGVLESTQTLRSETTTLSQSLKSHSTRGRWGEVQLKRVIELSGMSKHCDFTEQTTTVSAEDARLRPDLIIQLPSKRCIVVDAKAVLTGYLEAEEAKEEVIRKAALVRHAGALRSRIQELSRKNYWDQFPNSPEFVVLFIPGEVFFSAALQEAPDLVEYGFQQKIVLATPTTLMALLKAVAYGWRQEQMADGARRISDEAARIYQGLSVWTGHLQKVGTALDAAAKSYNAAVGSLERTVMPPLKRMNELGVRSKDEVGELKQVEQALRQVATGEPPAENV